MMDFIKTLDYQVIDLDQLQPNSQGWLVLEFLPELPTQRVLIVQQHELDIPTTRPVDWANQTKKNPNQSHPDRLVLQSNLSRIANKPIYLQSKQPIIRLLINFKTKVQVKLFWVHTDSSQQRQLIINLLEPEIRLELYSLIYAQGRMVIENRLEIRHLAKNCQSYTLFKSVLEEGCKFHFHGKIYVSTQAYQTDAELLNHNVILDDTAVATSRPELEILCDDVKCRHGATIGGFNKEQDFYLQARGIPQAARRAILTSAFLGEVVKKIQSA